MMKLNMPKLFRPKVSTWECLLEEQYVHLKKWSRILTQGDMQMAEELLQELCLQLLLSRPDPAGIKDLQGYLYISMRNLQLSMLARRSRDLAFHLPVLEYDTLALALEGTSPDELLDRQNELRSICNYAIWRKETAKSASYLLLLFFHGYTRQEIAVLAQLPLSAIYNKLKQIRDEIRQYLESENCIRVAVKKQPPIPRHKKQLLFTRDLYAELRHEICSATATPCLPQTELIESFLPTSDVPICCALLAHIVSCKECLAIVDRHFSRPTLDDREPPQESGYARHSMGGDMNSSQDTSFSALMKRVQKRKENLEEHRPGRIAIAVDGRIVSMHGLQSEETHFALQIPAFERIQYVEIFSDQGLRLMATSLSQNAAERPLNVERKILLSDARSMHFSLLENAEGVNCEISYFDPALNASEFVTQGNDRVQASGSGNRNVLAAFVRNLCTQFTFAHGMGVSVLSLSILGSSALLYRDGYIGDSPVTVLRDVQSSFAAAAKGKVFHQLMAITVVEAASQQEMHGYVETWQQNETHRMVRKLLDAAKVPIAIESCEGENACSTRLLQSHLSANDEALLKQTVWHQIITSATLPAADAVHLRRNPGDFELRFDEFTWKNSMIRNAVFDFDQQQQMRSATFDLESDGRRQHVAMKVVESSFASLTEFPQISGDGLSSELENHGAHAEIQRQTEQPGKMMYTLQAQIALLALLHSSGAESTDAISVSRQADGKILLSGVVEEDVRRRAILQGVQSMAQKDCVVTKLYDPRKQGASRYRMQSAKVIDLQQKRPPFLALLEDSIRRKGMRDKALTSASAEAEQKLMESSQHLLGYSNAVNRLVSDFSERDLEAMGATSAAEWRRMLVEDAEAEDREVNHMRGMLLQLKQENQYAQAASQAGVASGDLRKMAAELHARNERLNRILNQALNADSNGAGDGEGILRSLLGALPDELSKEVLDMAHQKSHAILIPALAAKKVVK